MYRIILGILVIINISNILEFINLNLKMNEKNIYFLDVGQGDSTLIQQGDSYALIDTGNDIKFFNELDKLIHPNSHKLDFIIITHLDADHFENIVQMLYLYEIKVIFVNKSDKEGPLLDHFNELVSSFGVNVMELKSENDFSWGGCYFDIIWPLSNGTGFIEDENDKSISISLLCNGKRVLLMGDLSKEFELRATSYIKGLGENVNFDILKVSHHGSNSSTDESLLASVLPELAVISSGKDNSYGHPHIEVIKVLEKYGIDIKRTDLLGTIKIALQ